MKFNILASAAVVALALIGCKPTESNYRQAYDAAKAKREQAAAEQMRPATGLLSDDGPQQRIVDGDTIYVLTESLRIPDAGRPRGRWALAVGMFKMNTNAAAGVEAVRQKGFDRAFMATARGGKFYTIAATAQTLDSIRDASRRFQSSFPDYPYVGLPGAPVLISF